MNEVDKIIIKILSDLDLDIQEYTSLKDFSSDLIIKSAIICLKNITNDDIIYNISNIREKYRTCNQIIESLDKLGYKNSLSEEYFIYKHTNELRNIFMFLVQKLNKIHIKDKPKICDHNLLIIARSLKKNISLHSFPSYKWLDTTKDIRSYFLILPYNNKRTVIYKNPNNIYNDLLTQCGNKYNLILSLIVWNSSRKYIEQKSISKEIDINISLQNKVNLYESKQITDHQTIIQTKILPTNKKEDTMIFKNQLKKTIKRINKTELLNKELLLKLDELNINKNKFEEQYKLIINKNNQLDEIIKNLSVLQNILQQKQITHQLVNKVEHIKTTIDKDTNSFMLIQNELQSKIHSITSKSISLQNDITKMGDDIFNMESEYTQKLQQYQSLSTLKDNLTLQKYSDFGRKYLSEKVFDIILNIRQQTLRVKKVLKDLNTLYSDSYDLTDQINHNFNICHQILTNPCNSDIFAQNTYHTLSNIIHTLEDIINIIQRQNSISRTITETEYLINDINEYDIDQNILKIQNDLQNL